MKIPEIYFVRFNVVLNNGFAYSFFVSLTWWLHILLCTRTHCTSDWSSNLTDKLATAKPFYMCTIVSLPSMYNIWEQIEH